MPKISVSACVIVKNEEKHIERWLANVRRIADEIIVVDTGSTDRTVELAETGGAKVYFFEWIHDFSAAKNYALDQAHGDWIIFLDADEYFTEDALKRLPQVLQEVHPQRKIVGLISPFLNIDEADHGRVIDQAYQMRIFRRSRTLRYVGSVHEMIRNMAMESGKREYQMTDLMFIHTGYSILTQAEKNKRNLELLLQERAREGKDDPKKFPYFMDTYYSMGEFEKSLDYARRFLAYVDRTRDSQESERKAWLTLLFSMDQLGTLAEQGMAEVERALAKHPRWAELSWEKGKVFFRQMRYGEARAQFFRAMELSELPEENPEELQHVFMPTVMPELYYLLGRTYQEEGKESIALQYWQKSLKTYFYQERCLQDALRVLLRGDMTKTIAFFEALPLDDAAKKFLCEQLRLFPPGEIYLYFSQPKTDSYANFMIAGRYEDAAYRCARELAETYRRAAVQCEKNPLSRETLDWLRIVPPRWLPKFPQVEIHPAGKGTEA